MKRRGSILVGLLWVVTILSVIVVGSLHSSRMGLMAAKNYADKVQAHYIALAGVEQAKALIYHEEAARKKSPAKPFGRTFQFPGEFSRN